MTEVIFSPNVGCLHVRVVPKCDLGHLHVLFWRKTGLFFKNPVKGRLRGKARIEGHSQDSQVFGIAGGHAPFHLFDPVGVDKLVERLIEPPVDNP